MDGSRRGSQRRRRGGRVPAPDAAGRAALVVAAHDRQRHVRRVRRPVRRPPRARRAGRVVAVRRVARPPRRGAPARGGGTPARQGVLLGRLALRRGGPGPPPPPPGGPRPPPRPPPPR